MVTVSRSNAFQRNLLLSIGGVFLIFAIASASINISVKGSIR